MPLLLALTACATEAHAPGGVELCPTLRGDEADWVGIVAAPDRAEPLSCVSASIGEHRLARDRVAAPGSFALRFRVPAELRDRPITLRVGPETLEVMPPGDAEATIAYEPHSLPLVERPAGRVRFEGRLDSEPDATPIAAAWMVNWTTGWVEPIEAPRLDEPFSASVPGRRGHEAAVLSRHRSGGAGGCWWPSGGGGIAACSDEDRRAGLCEPPSVIAPCTGGRGCEPLPVDERPAPDDDAELDREIPVGDDRPGPVDGGPALTDGGFA